MYMVYIWVAILAAGLLLEAVEAGTLVTIWFSVGAIVPLIMSFFGITEAWFIVLEVIIFGIVTILSLVFLRKFAKKALFKNAKEKTNLDLIVGKKVKISRVENNISYIKLNGIEYRAVTEEEEDLQKGDSVEIIKMSGNKIVVKEIKE